MSKAIDMLGWTMILQLAGLALLFFVFALLPLWWPAWRARKHRWPRPWLFSLVVACLVYGLWNLLIVALGVPTGVYQVFLAPQLREAGVLEYGTLDRVLKGLTDYAWLAMLVLQVVMSVMLTRRLGRSWPGICRVLAESPAEGLATRP